MKIVWFIRHAESEANAGLPTSYPNSIALTSKGIQHARKLSETIDTKPDLIIVSSYIRTQQTAQPLMEKFPNVPATVFPIHEFEFLALEDCLNTTTEQRKLWVNDYWNSCDAGLVHGKGAESFSNFKNRVFECMNRIEKSEYDFIVVFHMVML